MDLTDDGGVGLVTASTPGAPPATTTTTTPGGCGAGAGASTSAGAGSSCVDPTAGGSSAGASVGMPSAGPALLPLLRLLVCVSRFLSVGVVGDSQEHTPCKEPVRCSEPMSRAGKLLLDVAVVQLYGVSREGLEFVASQL